MILVGMRGNDQVDIPVPEWDLPAEMVIEHAGIRPTVDENLAADDVLSSQFACLTVIKGGLCAMEATRGSQCFTDLEYFLERTSYRAQIQVVQ